MTNFAAINTRYALLQAQGNEALAALATVDIAFPRLSNNARRTLKMALVACAVPHWCDQSFLNAILGTSRKNISTVAEQIRELSLVEDFPSRGPGAFNINSAFRMAIRKYLRDNSPREWRLFSQRAHDYLATRTDQVAKIECLFLQFCYAPDIAVRNCRILDKDLTATGHVDARFLLASCLKELVEEGTLTGSAKIEANIVSLSLAGYRLSNQSVLTDAKKTLFESKQLGYVYGIERLHVLLGDILQERGKSIDAMLEYEKSFEICHLQILNDDTDYWGHRLGVVCSRVAQLQSIVGNFDSANAWASKYLEVAEGSLAYAPDSLDRRRRLSLAHIQMGSALEARGSDLDAKIHFYQALNISQILTEIDKSNVDWLRDLSVAHSRIGGLEEVAGNLDRAESHLNEDLRLVRGLISLDPGNLRWRHDLSVSLARIGHVHENRGKLHLAVEVQEERLSVLDELVGHNPVNLNWQRSRASALRSLGDIYRLQDRYNESYLAITKSKEVFLSLVELDPANLIWRRELAVTKKRLSDVLLHMGRVNEATLEIRETLSIYEELVSDPRPPAEWIRGLSLSHFALSVILRESRNLSEAREHASLAVAAMERAILAAPGKTGWLADLAEIRKESD